MWFALARIGAGGQRVENAAQKYLASRAQRGFPLPRAVLVSPVAPLWQRKVPPYCSADHHHARTGFFFFDFSLEKPATRPRDRCGTEQLLYPFVTGFPGSSRVSALAPYSSGDRVGSTLSTPHAGGDLGLFVGECSSPQTDAPNDDERVRLMSLTPPP